MILVIVDNRTTTSSSWLNYIDFLHLCPAYLLAASPATTNGSVRPLSSPLLSFPSLSTLEDVLQRQTLGRQQLLLQLHFLLQLLHIRTRNSTKITLSSHPKTSSYWTEQRTTNTLPRLCFNYDYNFFYY